VCAPLLFFFPETMASLNMLLSSMVFVRSCYYYQYQCVRIYQVQLAVCSIPSLQLQGSILHLQNRNPSKFASPPRRRNVADVDTDSPLRQTYEKHPPRVEWTDRDKPPGPDSTIVSGGTQRRPRTRTMPSVSQSCANEAVYSLSPASFFLLYQVQTKKKTGLPICSNGSVYCI
jgi:hypothetical protein